MKRIRALIASFISLLMIGLHTAALAQSPGIDGFSAQTSIAEQRFEEQFRSVPAGASAREHLRRLTAEPHIAGTKEDYATAVYVRDQMRSYGLQAELKEYQVWLNYPKTDPIVELVAPRRERLSVREAILKEDPTSSNRKITPLFNGYAATGDVTAPLVYANYGLPPDYEALEKAGVDVKGKIVIVRYGNSFRGVKAKVAQDHGAVGCIIYSDPADDGYAQGDVYPKGPWRPVAAGQRGSVQFLFQYPGDPLTPGKPAIPGTPRISLQEAYADIPRIPVQLGRGRVWLDWIDRVGRRKRGRATAEGSRVSQRRCRSQRPQLWRFVRAVALETDPCRDARRERSKDRQVGLSAMAGSRARTTQRNRSELQRRSEHWGAWFRIGFHAIPSAPGCRVDRHGVWRRLRRLSFGL